MLGDNAPCHSFNATYAVRQKLGITSINHPPNCSDLDAVENLQQQLRLRLEHLKRQVTSLDKLGEQIQQAWDELGIKTVNRLV